MIKITKYKIEEIVKKYIGKDAEYWGVCRNDNSFGFFNKIDNNWLFLKKKFFIDIIKEEQKNEIIEREKNLRLQKESDSDYQQGTLF